MMWNECVKISDYTIQEAEPVKRGAAVLQWVFSLLFTVYKGCSAQMCVLAGKHTQT